VTRLAAAIRAQAKIDPDDVGLRASVEMAANPHMHPHHVVLSELPRDGAEIAAAFKAQYLDRFGVDAPGNAYVFSLTLNLTQARAVPKPVACMATSGGAIVDEADATLVETVAGAIWKPAGWRLARTAGAYVLQRETR